MVKSLFLNAPFLKTVIFICFLSCHFISGAQAGKTEVILKKISDFNEQNLQEKVFVHTDRSSYVAGEIIWCKVYCTDAKTNHLSTFSKVAYVEVLDKDKQPVLQGKIALTGGTGSGSFVIPVTMHSGNFLLRSYTNWMKNFDPEFYFHQNLTILNTVKAEVVAASAMVANYDMQFFPEGGNLVDGLKSKVGFRVTDNSGKGINFRGAIIDQNNDTITRFQPLKFGIGNFIFTPEKGKQYKAFLTTGNGSVISQTLPATLNTGFVINVSDATTTGSVRMNVRTTSDNKTVFIVIHNSQQTSTSRVLTLENGNANLEVDKKSLADGISTITVFDENNRPVCERLYFKKPQQQQLFLDGTADNVQYTTRKKVTIAVSSKDEATNPEPSEMSMAVFLLDSLPLQNQNIYSYLWLSSELKGVIESPEYYVSNTNDEVTEAIDNLMLTHGWRRFKWETILNDKKPSFKFLPEYEGQLVSGKVVRKFDEKPVPNVVSYLSVPGPLFQLYAAKSAADGSIYFNTRNFYGTKLIVAQTKSDDTTSLRLDISSPFSEDFSSYKIPAFSYQTTSPLLLKRSIQMQVQNVYAGEKLNVLLPPHADTANFYGKADASYLLDNYVRFPTMEEVLREYVREIDVRKRKGNFYLISLSKDEFGMPIVHEPVMLLDGVPQFDNGNKITHYDPLKVRKLEVIQALYYLGPASFDGVASFTTYNGDLEGFRLDTASTVLDYDALQIKREFYSPVYQTPEQYSSRLPDFRNLLYWSSDIKTDNTGKKEVSFYTSDITGKYAVVLQGISQQGKAGSKVFTIDVRK